MTHWFVSRHEGAIAWAKHERLPIDRWVAHLDLTEICAGDVIIGTLPVHLAAEVCARGAVFYFLRMELREHQRGAELDVATMRESHCHLQRFIVQAAQLW